MPIDGNPGEPVQVKAGLERLLRHLGAPRADTLQTVFSHWEAVVGETVASHATPQRVRESVLVVDVTDPSWAAELKWMRSDLIAKIHAATGDTTITDISFRVRRH